MGSDPIFKYQILLLMSLQLSLAYIMRDQSWTNLFIASYCLGAVATSGLMAGVHDISHNIAFGNGRPLLNRLYPS